MLVATVLFSACAPAPLEAVPIGSIPRSTLEAAGLDPRYWQAMLEQVRRENLPIDGIAFALGDEMLAQEYFGPYAENIPHDLRSSTKGITGLLVGIALDRGLIPSVDTPVADFFPEFQPHSSWAGHKPLTLRNLLTMQSGLDCDDWQASTGNEEKMYLSRDWLQFFLAIPRITDPGQSFRYCTAGVVVLGEIVARAAHRPLPEFAQEALFGPLGILEASWASAPKGVTDAGGHLRLTPQSLLKLGMMVQNGGVWQGKQVVSQGWLRAMLEPHASVTSTIPQLRYGYLWLLPTREGRVSSYQTWGNGGQYLMVIPELRLVAAFTGHAYDDPRDMAAFELMNRYLIPMARRVPYPNP